MPASPTTTYPESPPRVRVEWLIASTRVALAASTLVAVTMDSPEVIPVSIVAALLVGYLVYGLAVLALVWSPVRFGRGWDVAVHVFDLAVFGLAATLTEVVTSPFFASFAFLVISSMLRWRVRGTIATVAAAFAVYSAVSLYGIQVMGVTAFRADVFLIRLLYLAMTAALLGFFGALQHRSHLEVVRLASWPRRISRDPREVRAEIIAHSSQLMEAPRVLIVWEEPSEGRVNLAWRGEAEMEWMSEAEGTYGALVAAALEPWSFQAANAEDPAGQVVSLTDGGFRYRHMQPLNDALRARFNMTAVQSWPLAGELIQGRLFALDKRRMRIDDLLSGELVARLAVSRLDSLYLLDRLRDAAALEARVRIARDLHDSLLQAQTGAALQLLVARRLLDKDPVAGKERLEDVQRLLEWGELDMRSFIRRLRPEEESKGHPGYSRLSERLEVLRRRIGRQWDVKIVLRLQGVELLSGQIVEDVYRLAQEAAINAARHADPSVIKIDLTVEEDKLRLGIADDGHGFPFRGTYDLNALSTMKEGPLTLKERVAELHGEMILRSHDNGTQVLITLPFTQVSR